MTSKPKRIAQILGTVSTGGVASCVYNFYKHIDHTKYQFDFYTYDDFPNQDEILALGGRVIHYPKVFNVPKCVSFLRKKFKENGYDIVHVHLTTLSFVPLLAAKQAKVKYRLCHAHSTTHKEEGFKHTVKTALRLISSKNATNLLGCSNLSINWLYRKRADEAFLLRNAIDLDKFTVSQSKREFLREQYDVTNKKVVGFIGRFEVQKNVLFLIKTFSYLTNIRDDAVLYLVGDGSLKDSAVSLINELGLDGKVKILPEIREVENYYALFDVFVLPSRYEGLPLVAVEAQTVGVPCLLSQYVTHEVDITKKCSFMSIDGEKAPQAWAKKISEELDKPRQDNKELIKSAGYDIKDEAKRLEKYYDGLNE